MHRLEKRYQQQLATERKAFADEKMTTLDGAAARFNARLNDTVPEEKTRTSHPAETTTMLDISAYYTAWLDL